ncbi:conserved exported hypothetical protein [Methylocella tundrae]|uniref:Uncharacterized protein n=1 Tax=Methylocella tundrae TaxID=227605 RepID=A0A8B6M721_METTU|nr:hypothetical protein [Methylocella tundrae]VTZ50626.1 conserved exported hypothetical protein [Methylocella tundrae]
MKKALLVSAAALIAVSAAIFSSTKADAYVCARGPYRAGCAGARGGVVVRRGPAYYPRGGVVVRRHYGPYGGGVVVRRRYY